MNTIINLIKWLNGKKTVIGAFLIALALFLQDQIVGALNVHEVWLDTLIVYLQWAGAILGGTGFVHKLLKPGQPKPETVNPDTKPTPDVKL